MKKMSLNTRVYMLANKYGLEQNKVHMIITGYIDYCKEMLYQGYRVDILGLASLIPNELREDCMTTLAYECKYLAEQLKLPSHTVYVIVQEYINSLIDDVLNGKPIEVRGLFSVVPINDGKQVVKIHSVISSQVKEHLKERETFVTSIRIHTHKLLKYKVSNSDRSIVSEEQENG